MKKWRNHILNSQFGTGLHYLEGMSSYVFMSCVESLWNSGGAEPQLRGHSIEEGNQLPYVIKEGKCELGKQRRT